MKTVLLFLACFCSFQVATAQGYWQQQTDYTIDVSLNDKDRTLDGFLNLVYTNHSPDTLTFLWFHLWPNAYKNDRTALSDQLLENGNTAFYFANKEQRGYINRLQFRVEGITARTEDHPQHIDITKLLLPKPLLPGGTVRISTPFHVKLPFPFLRSGTDGQFFQITHWYPKPAVYDRNGWHPMPYLNQGEGYSEFGTYDVRITLPQPYVVAATGVLQNSEEWDWLKTRQPPPATAQPKTNRTVVRKKTVGQRTIPAPPPTAATAVKTLRFLQSGVHDFAWFANQQFRVQADTVQLPGGKAIELLVYHRAAGDRRWDSAQVQAKRALRFYSSVLGDYPYNTASVVQAAPGSTGSNTYPGITVVDSAATAEALDLAIAHGLGHQWLSGAVANNQRAHPWLDEGPNGYLEQAYRQQQYGRSSQERELFFQLKARSKTDQPIATPAPAFSPANYDLVAYHKATEWMKEIERAVGPTVVQQLLKTYVQEWTGRHPGPADFATVMRSRLGSGTDSLFALLEQKGVLPGNRLGGTRLVFPLAKNSLANYTRRPAAQAVLLLPALGFNSYDKLMLGALVSNYGSPAARFNYVFAPMVATGSRRLVGLGRLQYTTSSEGPVQRTDVFLSAASFTDNRFTSDEGTVYRTRFAKLVPGVRFTLRPSSPRSTATAFVQWKTFLFREQRLRVRTDSVITPTDTTIVFRYSTPASNRYLNQLQLVYRNHRALYPFDVVLQVEQAEAFVRTALTANYFFNYAKGGGLSVRFFGGKFSYLGTRTTQRRFATDRYHLNLTGANGYEDYTYSDYFVGRNLFNGAASQQIMLRDGGFKVRTDLLASKVGKTDDWLLAANFVTTVPQKFNPLAVLPVKIPLRLFADIGTYAEAWNRNADADRFVFDAGLQLSFFKETLNVYLPLLYSPVFRSYIKSTIPDNRLLKTISFTIDFFNPSLRKLHRQFEF